VEHDRQKNREQCQHRGIPLPALRVVRQCAALSQRQLADLAGVSANTVRLLEGGKRGAYPTTVAKLAAALGLPPEELVRGLRRE
jgi:transcriptional regulator with XRE-family HTH domain